jgi:hypothetical protein
MIACFKDLVEAHPEILQDRHGLTFRGVQGAAEAFRRSGAVMLRQAFPTGVVEAARDAFDRSLAIDPDGHRMLWEIRDGNEYPATGIISALLGSWAWAVVERLCGSRHIAIPLGYCVARNVIDRSLSVGAHQDAFGFGSGVPFSVWIPLQPIKPMEASGLGFMVPALDHVVPADNQDNVGRDAVLSDPAKLWIPTYEAGDVTIHSNLLPHFTTGYGTLSRRYSLEIRPLRRLTAPMMYLDPAIYVAQRDGRAVVSGIW